MSMNSAITTKDQYGGAACGLLQVLLNANVSVGPEVLNDCGRYIRVKKRDSGHLDLDLWTAAALGCANSRHAQG